MHRLQELVRLHRQGKSKRESARLLGMGRNTLRRYLVAFDEAGLLDGEPEELPRLEVLRLAVDARLPTQPASQTSSTVDAWALAIGEMAERGAKPKAIFDALRLSDPDFDGSLDAVKRFYRRWRTEQPPSAVDVAILVETGPGKVAQVDFGYIGTLFDPIEQRLRRAWVFVMVLGFCRHMFAKIVFDQKTTTWLQLHVEAFAEFGGVPEVVVPDNLKAAVTRAAFGVERDKLALNRSYRDLARHYGFVIDPAPPYSPEKKGKVENAVRYVKSSFFKPRALEEITEAQSELTRWRFEIAGTRVHGTTHRQPLELFEQQEQEAMLALPARPFIPRVWKTVKVHPDSHILFEKRKYSLPWAHIGKKAWLCATPESVTLYIDDVRVATHNRHGTGPATQDCHLPKHRRDLRYRSRDYWIRRARGLGETVGEYVEEVFGADEVLSQLRTVQAIVTHLEKFPPSRAVAACERARFYGNHTYRGVRDILRKGLDQEPLPALLFPDAKPGPRPRFSRVPAAEA